VFEQFRGIPLHPLVLHAAVVFIPLLAAGAVAYAVIPRLRARIGWEVALLALAGAGSAVVTKLAGDALRARYIRRHAITPDYLVMINQHRSFGNMTVWLTIALAVLALLMVIVLPRVGQRVLNVVIGVVAVGLSAACLYYVFRTGDLGAHIVWNGK